MPEITVNEETLNLLREIKRKRHLHDLAAALALAVSDFAARELPNPRATPDTITVEVNGAELATVIRKHLLRQGNPPTSLGL